MNADNRYYNEWNRQEQYQNNQQDRHNAYDNLNKNQQQMLKNQGALRMQDRKQDGGGSVGRRGRFR